MEYNSFAFFVNMLLWCYFYLSIILIVKHEIVYFKLYDAIT